MNLHSLPEIHWADDNESLVLAGRKYVPESRLLLLREALKEALPYMHRNMQRIVPGMRDDGYVVTVHERNCHDYLDDHHVCVGCVLEARLGLDNG